MVSLTVSPVTPHAQPFVGRSKRRPYQSGISPGGVHCRLQTTGQCFTDLVRGHDCTARDTSRRRMEFELLLVGPVVLQPVLSKPSGFLQLQG